MLIIYVTIKQNYFNPEAVLIMKLDFIYLENVTQHISNDKSKLGLSLALVNRIHIYKKIGVTFGFILLKETRWGFNEIYILYEVDSEIKLYPTLTIDISIPSFSKKKD